MGVKVGVRVPGFGVPGAEMEPQEITVKRAQGCGPFLTVLRRGIVKGGP